VQSGKIAGDSSARTEASKTKEIDKKKRKGNYRKV